MPRSVRRISGGADVLVGGLLTLYPPSRIGERLASLLRDLDKLLAQETGLPVIVAEDPLTCVARGGGRALEL